MSKRVEEPGDQIPLWLVASLGKKVAIEKNFFDGVNHYPAGHQGLLMSIRGDALPEVAVDIALNPNDPTDWERFYVWEIRPASGQTTFSLDIERGLIVF